jgi:hypothetical protein
MRKIVLTAAALGALLTIEAPSFAQGITVGPGGLRVDGGSRYGREYEPSVRESGRGRRVCAELRDACRNKNRYKEGGQGNCRRYHRTCG